MQANRMYLRTIILLMIGYRLCDQALRNETAAWLVATLSIFGFGLQVLAFVLFWRAEQAPDDQQSK